MNEEPKPKIEIIPYRDKPYPPIYIVIVVLSILGLLTLIIIWMKEDKVTFCIRMGLLTLLISLAALIEAKRLRRNWVKITGTVLDSEIIIIQTRHKKLYNFRLLCEVEFKGEKYKVTPELHWKSYTSESKALDTLNSLVDQDQQCRLWINPKTPKQTELVTKGLRDRFLFG